MSSEDDDADEIARSFLESQRMNRLADYVARGRAFENLSNEVVSKGWRDTMRAMAFSPFEHAQRDMNNDYESELGLRGLPPPEGTEEAEQFLAVTKRLIKDQMSDPDERDRIMGELAKDLGDFQDQKDRSN